MAICDLAFPAYEPGIGPRKGEQAMVHIPDILG
jgi:hypothetical protein